MTLHTVVQRACRAPNAPDTATIESWARAACRSAGTGAGDLELTVRMVDEDEAAELNRRYRNKNYAPNVLSFPMNAGGSFETGLLGDVVICPVVAEREAVEQGKPLEAHWSHLVVHGVLHCCGLEHETDDGAARMEALEKRVLAEFGFPDPYTVHHEQ